MSSSTLLNPDLPLSVAAGSDWNATILAIVPENVRPISGRPKYFGYITKPVATGDLDFPDSIVAIWDSYGRFLMNPEGDRSLYHSYNLLNPVSLTPTEEAGIWKPLYTTWDQVPATQNRVLFTYLFGSNPPGRIIVGDRSSLSFTPYNNTRAYRINGTDLVTHWAVAPRLPAPDAE
jgi:hypothetical protein